MTNTTGRLPSITEDHDASALLAAHRAGGLLPIWTEPDSIAAFERAGYLSAEHRSFLSPLGMDVAAVWAEIKAQTAAGFRIGGRFTLVQRGERDETPRGDRYFAPRNPDRRH